MDATDLLVDAFGRVADTVHAAVVDLTEAQHAGQAAFVRGIVEREGARR